jgi:hypothetical protein
MGERVSRSSLRRAVYWPDDRVLAFLQEPLIMPGCDAGTPRDSRHRATHSA